MKINWVTVTEYAIAIVIGMAIYSLLDKLVFQKIEEKIVKNYEE